MQNMPSRDINGRCEGECRDLAADGEKDRQKAINLSGVEYDTPAERTPSWTTSRNEPPGSMGGRV
ncbi:conserved hypothetical protein [Desulfosarcina cetonica]|nr:conserved hypothetical protein [Desulfosarcina cetonica]